jgi:DNA-binding response OmpR family regulator
VHTLIVEHDTGLATIWARFLERQGLLCELAANDSEAYAALRARDFDAMILDMQLPEGSALRVADFACYRNPDIPIIAVTARNFFSGSTIFDLIPNARGLLREPLRLGDMAALVQHYGSRHASSQQAMASSG